MFRERDGFTILVTKSHYEIESIESISFLASIFRKEVIDHQGSDRGNAGHDCVETAAFKTS